MEHYPHQQRKPTPRLQGFDYSSDGAYFVTICVQHRLHLFGQIREGAMVLNGAGKMVAAVWYEICEHPRFVNAITTNDFVAMPNHVHGILHFSNSTTTLSAVIQHYKAVTTHLYSKGVHEQGWEPYQGHLWQRTFHDRIVRNEQEFYTFRDYILNNPARWEADTFNT